MWSQDLLHAQGRQENLSNAMALRSLGAGIGGVGGVWFVGLAVERLGMWAGFAIVGGQMALLLLLMVPSQPPARKKGAVQAKPGSVGVDLRAGLSLAWSDPKLASILSVTIIANFLYLLRGIENISSTFFNLPLFLGQFHGINCIFFGSE